MSEAEQETSQKPTSNPNPAEHRNSLFAYLGHCIRLIHEKMSSKGNSYSAKQSWGGLMVLALFLFLFFIFGMVRAKRAYSDYFFNVESGF